MIGKKWVNGFEIANVITKNIVIQPSFQLGFLTVTLESIFFLLKQEVGQQNPSGSDSCPAKQKRTMPTT